MLTEISDGASILACDFGQTETISSISSLLAITIQQSHFKLLLFNA